MKEQRWQDWIVVLLGIWLLFSPFFGIGGIGDLAAINSYLVGTAAIVFGIAAIVRPQLWQEYAALALGFWLIIAPFALSFPHLASPVWNQIIVGLLIGGFGLLGTLRNTTLTEGHDNREGHGHV